MIPDRTDPIGLISHEKLILIFNTTDLERAKGVAHCVHQAGGRLLEFTNRSDDALALFRKLFDYCVERIPDLCLGAGTIKRLADFLAFRKAGARFTVAPNLDPDVVKTAAIADFPHIPGCGTVTEVHNALELGAKAVKVFPVPSVSWAKSVLGPYPGTKLIATGGIELHVGSLSNFLRTGWTAIGGSGPIQKAVQSGDFSDLASTLRQLYGQVEYIRTHG